MWNIKLDSPLAHLQAMSLSLQKNNLCDAFTPALGNRKKNCDCYGQTQRICAVANPELFTADTNLFFRKSKQWINGSLVNFISEAKSVSKQDVIRLTTRSSKVVQWSQTIQKSIKMRKKLGGDGSLPIVFNTWWDGRLGIGILGG